MQHSIIYIHTFVHTYVCMFISTLFIIDTIFNASSARPHYVAVVVVVVGFATPLPLPLSSLVAR